MLHGCLMFFVVLHTGSQELTCLKKENVYLTHYLFLTAL
jgi:hypothetical protein